MNQVACMVVIHIREKNDLHIYQCFKHSFTVNVNPALFGYEKECFLTLKHFYKKQANM